MVGNWKWNLGLGLFAMLFTMAFTLLTNTFWTAIIRSCYSFLLFYAIAFIPRFLLTSLPSVPAEPDQQMPKEEDSEEDFQPASFSEVDAAGQVVRQWSNE